MNNELPYASKYYDLVAYKVAMVLANQIFNLLRTFPKEEDYSLTNQIRRSSRSIGAQIAEAWGKRLYIKHFKSKLTDSIAELNETQHWIDIALNSGYITKSTRKDLFDTCDRIKRLIHGMINKADRFCTHN